MTEAARTLGSWFTESGAGIMRSLILAGILWLVNASVGVRESVVEINTRLKRVDMMETELTEARAVRHAYMNRVDVTLVRVDGHEARLAELRRELEELRRQIQDLMARPPIRDGAR